MEWENIFANRISDKTCFLNILCKGHLQFKNENITQLKMDSVFERIFL